MKHIHLKMSIILVSGVMFVMKFYPEFGANGGKSVGLLFHLCRSILSWTQVLC